MTVTRVIRYTTRPEAADENERLIRDVFAELAVERPAGLRYEAMRLADGHSFVHVVTVDGADNPLMRSTAFAAFQERIGERCSEGPTPSDASIVGTYDG
jgi:hypothetical protein